jgi:hypothetical protein
MNGLLRLSIPDMTQGSLTGHHTSYCDQEPSFPLLDNLPSASNASAAAAIAPFPFASSFIASNEVPDDAEYFGIPRYSTDVALARYSEWIDPTRLQRQYYRQSTAQDVQYAYASRVELQASPSLSKWCRESFEGESRDVRWNRVDVLDFKMKDLQSSCSRRSGIRIRPSTHKPRRRIVAPSRVHRPTRNFGLGSRARVFGAQALADGRRSPSINAASAPILSPPPSI